MSDNPGDFTIDGMDVRGMTRVTGRFRNATQALHDRLLGIIETETTEVAFLARQRLAELFPNPQKMQNAIESAVQQGDSFILGSVVASGLPYLRIHEFGGVTQPHPIAAVNASALAFQSQGFFRRAGVGKVTFRTGAASDTMFAKHVEHPGSVMPERSYLRYALTQRRSAIRAAFAQAASDAAGGT